MNLRKAINPFPKIKIHVLSPSPDNLNPLILGQVAKV